MTEKKNSEYMLPPKKLLDDDDMLENERFYNLSKLLNNKYKNDKLVIPLGIDEKKEKYYLDLQNIPLLLICGESGSGKSVFLDSTVISLLLKNTPDELNFLFIDPKLVELSEYKDIPHVIFDGTVQDKTKIDYLNGKIRDREAILEKYKCKNIDEYNSHNDTKLEKIILIADEITDIIDDESFGELLRKIANRGSDYGIYIIIATNSSIKENIDKSVLKLFTYIISFDLASKEESKYLRIKGANLLKSNGEALIKCRNNDIIKMQMPYVSDKQIKAVVDYIKNES